MRSLALLLLGGCQVVFPLDDQGPPLCSVGVDGADEDGDGIFDPEDNCPVLASQDVRDSDGDGVGDACDPRPGLRDKLCFFGFNDAVELDLLERQSADWEVAGGALSQPVSKFRDAAILPFEWVAPVVTLRAHGLSASTGMNDTPHFGAIVAGSRLDQFIPDGVVCDIENHFDVAPTLRLRLFPGFDEDIEDLEEPNDQLAMTLTTASPNEGKPACAGDHGGATSDVVLPNVGPQNGQIAVFVEGATIAIDSIQVIANDQ